MSLPHTIIVGFALALLASTGPCLAQDTRTERVKLAIALMLEVDQLTGAVALER
jgi:hypothetical protein